TTDAGERGLRTRLQRRNLDGEVVLRVRAAREAPAALQLLDRECARIDRADRRVPRDHLDLALLARAMAAARGVDGDAVPAGGVEDRRAGKDARLLDGAILARLEEAQANAVRVLLLREVDDRTHAVAAACFSRYMRIQVAPHSPRCLTPILVSDTDRRAPNAGALLMPLPPASRGTCGSRSRPTRPARGGTRS